MCILELLIISHEILHQFGAWDLYQGKSQTLKSAKKAIELFPNSIMINTKRKKAQLKIDGLTAWRVGWKKKKWEYDQFNPKTNGSKEELNRKKNGGGVSFKFDLKRKKKKKNVTNKMQNDDSH